LFQTPSEVLSQILFLSFAIFLLSLYPFRRRHFYRTIDKGPTFDSTFITNPPLPTVTLPFSIFCSRHY
jgi:hypothetical protein